MSRSLELVNRHPAQNDLSFDMFKPGMSKAPGTMKRRVAPIGIKVPKGGSIDLCKQLECSFEDAEEAIRLSPQCQSLIRRGWLMRRESHSGEETAAAAEKATRAANRPPPTPPPPPAPAAPESAASSKDTEPPEAPAEPALEEMKKGDLVKLARELDVPVTRGMKVSALVKAIQEKQAEGSEE